MMIIMMNDDDDDATIKIYPYYYFNTLPCCFCLRRPKYSLLFPVSDRRIADDLE